MLCGYFSWWESVPGSGDFWEGSGNDLGWPERKTKHGEDQDFSRISTTGNGVGKKVFVLVLQKL